MQNKEDVVLKYYRKKCRTVLSYQVISIDMNISSLSSPQDILTTNDETSDPEIQWQHATDGLYFVVIIFKDGTVLTQKMMVQK